MIHLHITLFPATIERLLCAPLGFCQNLTVYLSVTTSQCISVSLPHNAFQCHYLTVRFSVTTSQCISVSLPLSVTTPQCHYPALYAVSSPVGIHP